VNDDVMAPRILVLNAGSSSLKWSLVDGGSGATLAAGNEPWPPGTPPPFDPHRWLEFAPEALAYRVVHGGVYFRGPVRLDDETVAELETLRPLNPLHAERTSRLLELGRRALPSRPHVACFDTAFHATLPEHAATYGLPRELTRRFGLRRYGFHGLSVAHATARVAELAGALPSRLVVCHLGSGCSVTAVRDGRSVDTTMGFSPLEGLVMATRSGSVDPGALLFLLREGGLDAASLEQALEREGGLLGLSGLSADLREITRAADAGDAQARLAYDVFVHVARRGVGQMLASLGGVDALAFTGGIGEHQARVRRDMLEPFAFAGLALDPARNDRAHPDAEVSAEGARARSFVVEAREDLVMAREAAALLAGPAAPASRPAQASPSPTLPADLGPRHRARRSGPRRARPRRATFAPTRTLCSAAGRGAARLDATGGRQQERRKRVRHAARAPREATMPLPDAPATVLIVDDHEANRALARGTLEDEGDHVVVANDGLAGVAAFCVGLRAGALPKGGD
jgi:acetate kinase